MKITKDGCDHCIDPDGLPCLPEYGLAPHKSFSENGKVISSEFTNEEDPDFEPDPDDPKVGIWYCPTKGCPNSKEKQKGSLKNDN